LRVAIQQAFFLCFGHHLVVLLVSGRFHLFGADNRAHLLFSRDADRAGVGGLHGFASGEQGKGGKRYGT
jgi:hypothetical protein